MKKIASFFGLLSLIACVTTSSFAETGSTLEKEAGTPHQNIGFSGISKQPQTITFPELSDKTFGDPPFVPGATASSGLAVSYASSDSSVATVSGNILSFIGAGTVSITASQAGNSNYSAAPDVQQSLKIVQGAQTISFPSIPSKLEGDLPFALNAVASSGLPVSYVSSNEAVATVSGNIVTVLSKGTTKISASQPGNADYLAAADVSQTLSVCWLVTSNADSGEGSLRQAVSDAFYGDSILFNLPAGSETIVISSPIELSESLSIDGANILGSGVMVTIQVPVPGPGGTDSNIFQVSTTDLNQIVTISNMTLKGGDFSQKGGCISIGVCGSTILNNLTLTGAKALGGGAVYMGSGLLGYIPGLTMNGCTVSGNSAQYGGGIRVEGGSLTLSNCTVSGNNVTLDGGGISCYGTRAFNAGLFLNNSTVANNSAQTGAGGLVANGFTTNYFANSIIANNLKGTDRSDISFSLPTYDNGYNVFGAGWDPSWVFNGTKGNSWMLSGTDGDTYANITSGASGNLNLSANLADNGGATQTLALGAGSVALNAIPIGNSPYYNNSPATDQRGVARAGNSTCIGAYSVNQESSDESIPKLSVCLNNDPEGKDRVSISQAPLPFSAENFSTGDSIGVSVDDAVFICSDPTRWKSSASKHVFRSSSANKPGPFQLTIDFAKQVWSFTSAKATVHSLIDNSDGLLVKLHAGDSVWEFQEYLKEKTSWKFVGGKNTGKAIEGLEGTPMTKFEFGPDSRAEGKLDSTKAKKDSFKFLADVDLDAEDISTSSLQIDGMQAIPILFVQPDKSRRIYNFATETQPKISIVLDLEKNKTIVFKMSETNCSDIYAGDGLDIVLRVGEHVGGYSLNLSTKTALNKK